MSRAHAPVAGRRACRVAIIGRRARLRQAPLRSAVTVSPVAPELSLLTGFSRSDGSAALSRLPLAGEAPLRSVRPSPGLAAGCGHPVDTRCTICVCTGRTRACASAAGQCYKVRRPLHVFRTTPGGPDLSQLGGIRTR